MRSTGLGLYYMWSRQLCRLPCCPGCVIIFLRIDKGVYCSPFCIKPLTLTWTITSLVDSYCILCKLPLSILGEKYQQQCRNDYPLEKVIFIYDLSDLKYAHIPHTYAHIHFLNVKTATKHWYNMLEIILFSETQINVENSVFISFLSIISLKK